MPSEEAVQKALAMIRKRAANYEYFFEHLNSPDWFAPLRAAGLFQKPPPAERKGDMISFPGWAEARYLARIAARAPDAVLDVLLKLPATDNLRVHDELMLVALALPPRLASRWSKRETKWLADQSAYYFLPERVGALVVHLASGGEADAALALAGRMFETSLEPDTSRVVRDVRIKMRDWEYGELLRRCCLVLVATIGERAFTFFLTLLEAALRASETEGTAGYSWVWRPAIEEHEQNVGHRPLDDLVASARDAAEYVVRGDILPATEVARRLLDRGGVFARLALHVLAKFPDRAKELAERCIADRALFDSVEVRHEYDALLETWFGRSPEEARQSVLGWIEAGPGEDRILRWKEQSMPETEIRRGVQLWQRDRLYPLRNSLTDVWRGRYAELVAAVGEAEHPGFTSYRRTFVGPTTPKSASELCSMTTDELLRFLGEWRPKDDWMQPSEDGLGRKLEEVVAADPDRFATECERFASVDATYVRSLLAGLATAMRTGKAFDWVPVLRLCSWVVDQARAIPGRPMSRTTDRDPDWGWTRKQVADLFVGGLEPRGNGIPQSCRKEVWRILEALSRDPDPDTSFNDKSNMDVLSQALNTVRGQTMHAVMNYALWVHRAVERPVDDAAALGLVPEVAVLLDVELDPQIEPTHAVRGVYGRWLCILVQLDPEWVRSRLDRIFPDSSTNSGLRLAAWESYLASTRLDAKLFALLEPQYRWAVSRLGTPPATPSRTSFVRPDERLAEHLITLCWQGDIAVEGADGLLDAFFERAPASLREHALSFAGRCLHGTPTGKLSSEVGARLKTLFERRLDLALAAPETHATELRGFSWWFSTGALDGDWRFAQLKRLLSAFPAIEGDFLVVEELLLHVGERPIDVLECIALLLCGENPWWLVIGSRAKLEAILSMTLASGDAAVRDRSIGLVHHLGSLGHSEFRRLLERRPAAASTVGSA